MSPEKPVAEALEMMGREDVNQVPVVQPGKLAGIISREQILRVLQTPRGAGRLSVFMWTFSATTFAFFNPTFHHLTHARQDGKNSELE